MQGLIIKPKWADLILDGFKTWEIRGSRTHKRGTIGIIKSGSGKVYGQVDLVDCLPCPVDVFGANFNKHCIKDTRVAYHYNQAWAWVFANPVKYPEPVPYVHPQGAVIWVNLGEEEHS
ncbi:ASCH domain-containing protein [Paenibacillus massiliensis]|uniref:ASCH domain-containing protein n=1 Tax=Paenibacillus massiliensis TaxID=225917 RepID=UPI0003FCA025|nr:ASCH domain-containing protein [Paenibacillus massiliensis]